MKFKPGNQQAMFLKTQGLTKEFGKLRAVNEVTLEIRQGDIHAIIGPNGAGKSTYFNLITGYHRVTTGKTLFKDKEITYLPAYRRCKLGITRSFQITSIYPKLSVYESVLMGLLTHVGLPSISSPRPKSILKKKSGAS